MPDYKTTNDLVYDIAKRVRELADYKMAVLRKFAEADISCDTRGKLLEWVLIEEFIEDHPKGFADL